MCNVFEPHMAVQSVLLSCALVVMYKYNMLLMLGRLLCAG